MNNTPAHYTLTALLTPKNHQAQPLESRTDLQRHRYTHGAGIPEFSLTENRLIAITLHFTARPNPNDPNLPHPTAQQAAIAHLHDEIHQRYPGTKANYQLYKK